MTLELRFSGEVIEWRGPAPYHFVPVPDDECADIHEVAAIATYGWGVIPVEARIEDVTFETSLFPRAAATCCRSRTPCASRSAYRPGTTFQSR